MQVAEKHHTDRDRPRWLVHLAGPAILFIICTGFFWKIVLTNQYTWLESPDLANQILPWLQVQTGEWHRGRAPLWDPTRADVRGGEEDRLLGRCGRRTELQPVDG